MQIRRIYCFALCYIVFCWIYNVSAALKDSLEHRLKRAGYVESIDIPAKKGTIKPIKKSLYSITPKGINLLNGWISFLTAYKND